VKKRGIRMLRKIKRVKRMMMTLGLIMTTTILKRWKRIKLNMKCLKKSLILFLDLRMMMRTKTKMKMTKVWD